MQKNINLYTFGQKKIAPVLYAYVTWIIAEARKRNIHTLYFLARDGYVLREIAKRICQNQHIPLECRYLYCSRLALRTPTYHLLGDEALQLIFAPGYHVTLRNIFDRARLPQHLWNTVLQEADIPVDTDVSAELTERDITAYRAKLTHSSSFMEHTKKCSEKSYPLILEYFRQEKLFEQESLAIVDSGWTGSMQRSLRQLLQSAGWNNQLIGFYFGMFASPALEDGIYLCYYFTRKKNTINKCLFCNNLFECFLSAPHGMTIGYEKHSEQTKVAPIYKDMPNSEQLQLINQQLSGILNGTDLLLKEKKWISKRNCEKILRKVMGMPQPSTVKLYKHFLFCDDMAENDCRSLVESDKNHALRQQLILTKFWNRCNHKKQHLLFWDYGVVALEPNPLKRAWYWLNVCIWKLLIYSARGILHV